MLAADFDLGTPASEKAADIVFAWIYRHPRIATLVTVLGLASVPFIIGVAVGARFF